VRRRTGNQDARYVFGLHEWAIEGAKDQQCLIATLKTMNGFEVCFGIPFEVSPRVRLESATRRRYGARYRANGASYRRRPPRAKLN
jgi:hypothetical protein